eukprot:m51a1_g2774 Sec31 (1235) ;mRNA; r:1031910-1036712
MKLKEVERSATIAWSPLVDNPRLIAAGTVAGSFDIDFNVSNKLELLDLQGEAAGLHVRSSLETVSGFSTLAWGPAKNLALGIIAGGTTEGSVSIYNPAAFGTPDKAVLCTQQKHSGAVQGLDFNPFQQNLLASAGADSEIYIWDLSDPTKPTAYDPGKKVPALTDISSVAWNRKVPTILASTGYSGSAVIWDLRLKRSLISFADKSRKAKWKAVAWNPTEPTSLITVCDEDENPVVMWDLRNIHQPRYFEGHRSGVWSATWSEHDPSLVVTGGKDRTLCWNPDTLQTYSEVQADASGNDWYAKTVWSPLVPATLAACSYGSHNPKISVHTLFDVRAESRAAPLPATPADPAPSQRPPKWMGATCGASFGFGGRLVTFNAAGKGAVTVRRMPGDEGLMKRAEEFDAVVSQGKFREFCEQRSADPRAPESERTAWRFIGVQFAKNVREEILGTLGFSRAEVNARIAELLEAAKPKEPAAPAEAPEAPESPASEEAAEEPAAPAEPQQPAKGAVTVRRMPGDEGLMKRAEEFDAVVSQGKFREFCEQRSADPRAPESERTAWRFIGVQFAKNVREEILGTLGFSRAEVSARIAELLEAAKPKEPAAPAEAPEAPESPASEEAAEEPAAPAEPQQPAKADVSGLFGSTDGDVEGADAFASIAAAPAQQQQQQEPARKEQEAAKEEEEERRVVPIEFTCEGEEGTIAKAVVLGDFEAAARYCESLGRHADALIIASCGGPEVFGRVRDAYVKARWQSSPMRLVDTLARTDLRCMIDAITPASWKAALAALCTYAKSSQFPTLTSSLGDKLMQAGDADAACLCYVAAGNVDKAVELWARNERAGHTGDLQNLVEKITILRHAVGAESDSVSQSALGKFMEYAVLLSSQGRMQAATRYLAFLSDPKFARTPAAMLLDRVRVCDGAKSAYRAERVAGNIRRGAAAPATILGTAATAAQTQQFRAAAPVMPPPSSVSPPLTKPVQRPIMPTMPLPTMPMQQQQQMPGPPTQFLPKAMPTFVPSPPVSQPMLPTMPAATGSTSPVMHAPIKPFVPHMPMAMPTGAPGAAPQSPAAMPFIPHVPGAAGGVPPVPVPAPMPMPMSPIMASNMMPQISRPKTEVMKTGVLAQTIEAHQAHASEEDVATVRSAVARLLTALQAAAAGGMHERHVNDTARKLDPLASQLPKLKASTSTELVRFTQAVEAKDWNTADHAIEIITKESIQELEGNVVTGLRFLSKLSRQLL